MRKWFVFLVVLLAVCMLPACSTTNGEVTYVVRPSMKIYSEESGFNYVVDTKTKVVYILYEYWSGYQGYAGLSPCLKSDGTPMLASDLGLE